MSLCSGIKKPFGLRRISADAIAFPCLLACVLGVVSLHIGCVDFEAIIKEAGSTGAASTTVATTAAVPARETAPDLSQIPELAERFSLRGPLAVDYAPSSADVPGMPAGLEPLIASALRWLNEIRSAAGLTPYSYSRQLAAAAEAHARYGVINCEQGKPYSGHFEVKSQPGYTPEGDAAARTSGLSYGTPNALAALEQLISGTYHRAQFLRPRERFVGAAFASGAKGCSLGLFVTRPTDSIALQPTAEEKGMRFVLFPPPGFASAPIDFKGENPDPRPGYSLGGDMGAATGFPITVSLVKSEDVRQCKGATAEVTKRGGQKLAIWVTDPAHPSVSKADRGIYAAGEANDSAFARNFDMVFIMPKEPLEPGSTYDVTVDLQIGAETPHLQWSFSTRPPRRWPVSARPVQPWRELQTALSLADAGDILLLDPGEYLVEAAIGLPNIRIIGRDREGTVIRFSPQLEYTPMSIQGTVVLENLTLHTARSALFIQPGGAVLLDSVTLKGGDGKTTPFIVEPDGILAMRNFSVSQFSGYYLMYARDPGALSPARVYADARSQASGVKMVYGAACVIALKGVEK